MREVNAILGKDIFLGRCGENKAACVSFNISDWQKTYGDGTPYVLHQRNGDKQPYPCDIEASGSTVTWCITNSDVAVAGRGRVELQYYKDDTLVKSETFTTVTERALGPASETAPEPYESWMETMLHTATDAQESAEAAAESESAASISAQTARAAEQNATTAASNAAKSESNAKASEISAANSASTSAIDATNAMSAAQQAQSNAFVSYDHMIRAEELAQEAEEASKTATDAAASVTGVVEAAAASAASAKASATEAKNAATDAAKDAAAEVEATLPGMVEEAANSAAAGVENRLSGYVSDAEDACAAAEEAKEAAEAAAKEAQQAAGGDFATPAYVDTKAATAEKNANKYTDQKIAAIPTPDVSGQINAHNVDSNAHADIRDMIRNIPTPDVSGQIATHNAATDAHADIREMVESAGRLAASAEVDAANALRDAGYAYDEAISKASIFYCYADSTELWEIDEQIDNGNIIILNDIERYVPLVSASYGSSYLFRGEVDDTTVITAYVDYDGWTVTESEIGGSSGIPEDHASTETTYGRGTSTKYGHVKLSDATNSTYAASAGIAASPFAVKSAYDKAVAAQNTANTAQSTANSKASKPTYVEATMLASGWADGKYSFEATYPHAQYNIEVSVADTATEEQFDAAAEAKIGSSATSNVFTARGEVPTVDIPVIVEVVAK